MNLCCFEATAPPHYRCGKVRQVRRNRFRRTTPYGVRGVRRKSDVEVRRCGSDGLEAQPEPQSRSTADRFPVACCVVARRCCVRILRHLLADFRSAPAACLFFRPGRTRERPLNIRGHQHPRVAGIGSPDPRNRCRPGAALTSRQSPWSSHRCGRVPTAAAAPVPPAGAINLVATDVEGCRRPPLRPATMPPHTTICSDLDPFHPNGSRSSASSPASLRRKRLHSTTDFFQIDGGVHG